MHIDMPEQLMKFIQHEVDKGLYNNASEVVRDAVRRMKEENSLNELRAELAKGLKDIEEGKTFEYTEELHEQIINNAIIKHKNRHPVKASVKPKTSDT